METLGTVRTIRGDAIDGNCGSAGAADAEAAAEVVAFFAEIARMEGWQPNGELDAYRQRSTFFALECSDSGGRRAVAGALQIVRPDESGALPNLRVWPELAAEVAASSSHAAHIAILAMSPPWRGTPGGASFWLLAAAMWRHCVLSDISELWLETTPRMFRCYRLLGWPLRKRGDLRVHWGEPCFPCSLSVREVAGTLAERAVRTETYRRILADMIGMARTVTAAGAG